MNSNKKIYFPGSWGLSNKALRNFYVRQSPNSSGIWEDIQIVENIDNADFVIVQDKPEENIPLDKKVIFFGREPSYIESHSYEGENLYLSFHHDKNETWLPQTWWLDMSYDELKNLKYPDKTGSPYLDGTKVSLSIIDSGKNYFGGHALRIKAIMDLITKLPNMIHVFGHITQGRQGSKPFMTALPPRSKERGLLSYKYNLSIENGQTECYFSEKIIDPILCWTTPIYFGCKDIDKFLPKYSYINVDPTKTGFVQEITNILKSGFHEENIEPLREARELILDKYNLLPTIKRALEFKKIL